MTNRTVKIAFGSIFLLLLARFLYPFFMYDVPLGYDPGLYRYLFLQYADAFPPFVLPIMRAEFFEYPVGLFFFTTYLVKLGVPVDWFIGWVWNLFPVILLSVLSFVWYKKEGSLHLALGVLIAGLFSAVYYQAFALMYWKALFSLLFTVLTFYFLEKKSYWMLPAALVAFLSHNQTGLLLGLVFVTWSLIHYQSILQSKRLARVIAGVVGVILVSILLYIPYLEQSVLSPLRSLLMLQGENAPTGSFPSVMDFLFVSPTLFIMGIAGFIWSFKKYWYSPFGLSILISLIFVVFQLIFHRRFLLYVDFFLLPFAAMFILDLMSEYKEKLTTVVLVCIVLLQAGLSYQHFRSIEPDISSEEFSQIQSLQSYIEDDATVIALDPRIAMWARGWVHNKKVGGPGLFGFPHWPEEKWQKFLFSSQSYRRTQVRKFKKPLYFLASDSFYEHYGDNVSGLKNDTCMKHIPDTHLLKYTCN